MLAGIVDAVARAGRPMCCADIAAAVDIDERALEGMLETLVARGRLRASNPGEQGCEACPIRSGCFLMRDGVARTYVPSTRRTGRPGPGPAWTGYDDGDDLAASARHCPR